ncbi:hypothetical protein F0562_008888 [Nyssa sinensis]|uniref:Uncharacterized protein n=1 Tax=Nyssa sinensis TaxID=561372 RepID=A0A5J5A7K5_9ASTE|nr:hypothetical protein F0562_008888 [Nyssa sinensis]
MATSFLMVSDQDDTGSFNESEEARTENVKQSGRRRSKLNESTQKKKQPQRGMGVAQLERLRLQERWKKMTEININPLHSLSLHHPHFLPSSLADPTPTGVSVPFGKFSAYGAINGGGQLNGGFPGLASSSGVGNGVFGDQFLVDPYGLGARNPSFRVENATETSKELSSMPNMKCYYENCSVCHKKKRINGEKLKFNGVKDINTDTSPINGCSFLGLNLGNNQNNDGDNQNFIARAPSHAAAHNVDQETHFVGCHKKGSVFLEYEFFPGGKGGKSTAPKELKLGSSEASVAAVGGEASFVTTTTSTGRVDASSSIDLSLKLSY